MITIKILNVNKLVEKEKGRFIAKFAPYFMNVEKAVEKRIVEELKNAFQEREVDAVIDIVPENKPVAF